MNKPNSFYYITHKNNLKSILESGIWSRSQLQTVKNRLLTTIGLRQKTTPIHSEDVIKKRKNKQFNGRSLWNYANVYFQPRNAMLYSLVKGKIGTKNIVILQINSDIIDTSGAGLTDGNAASQNTKFFDDIDQGLKALEKNQFDKTYWNETTKRTIMAEALIPHQIPKEKIMSIYTADQVTADQIRKDHTGALNIIPDPNMFFQPDYENPISNHITLKKGDMFFSKMQTFAISVNTVGIMGKGLASRAKYQFPDVYVLYQDLCRHRKLRMGVPYLYKREENYEKTLIEDGISTVTENGHRWFLLFPTKNHWREKSPTEGIKKGLQWLMENYKTQGIKSIALPALGCGLGGLDWKDIGPLMCQSLSSIDIDTSIYLPLEGAPLPSEQLNPKFLFNTELKPSSNRTSLTNNP